MKFELKPFSRKKNESANDVSSEELLGDLMRVVKQLNKPTVTSVEYRSLGKYGSKALVKRFGQSWFDVLGAAGLNETRSRLNIPKDEILEDLQRIASQLDKPTLTQQEYKDSGGRYSPSMICQKFGSWFKATELVGLGRSRTLGVTREEYFHNLEKVWIKLGRQPLYREIEKPFSEYSVGAYEARFGSWRKALEAFVAYMNAEEGESNSVESVVKRAPPIPTFTQLQIPTHLSKKPSIVHKTKRQVSDRLRFRVFYRDGMTCKICGKSRAKYHDLELVVDHIFPWAKGGETVFENLQTLCQPCNGGKGDLGQSDGL